MIAVIGFSRADQITAMWREDQISLKFSKFLPSGLFFE